MTAEKDYLKYGRYVLRNWRIDIYEKDSLIGLAYTLALKESVKKPDVGFNTIYTVILKSQAGMYTRRFQQINEKVNHNTLSHILDGDYELVDIYETLPSKSDTVEEVIFRDMVRNLNEFIERSPRYKRIMKSYVKTYSQGKTAEELQLSRAYINKTIRKIKNEFLEHYNRKTRHFNENMV